MPTKSVDFDRTYMKAQLINPEFLRDLAESYLKNSVGHSSMTQMHGRHLAIFAVAVNAQRTRCALQEFFQWRSMPDSNLLNTEHKDNVRNMK